MKEQPTSIDDIIRQVENADVSKIDLSSLTSDFTKSSKVIKTQSNILTAESLPNNRTALLLPENIIEIWNLKNGTKLHELRIPKTKLKGKKADRSKEGPRAYLSSYEHFLVIGVGSKLYRCDLAQNVLSLDEIASYPRGELSSLACFPDGRIVGVINSTKIWLQQPDQQEPVELKEARSQGGGISQLITLSKDTENQNRIAYQGGDNNIVIFDVIAKTKSVLNVSESNAFLELSSRHIACLSINLADKAPQIEIWDLQQLTQRPLTVMQSSQHELPQAFSLQTLSEEVIASGHRDGIVALWSLPEQKIIQKLHHDHQAVIELDVSDMGQLISLGEGGSLQMIEFPDQLTPNKQNELLAALRVNGTIREINWGAFEEKIAPDIKKQIEGVRQRNVNFASWRAEDSKLTLFHYLAYKGDEKALKILLDANKVPNINLLDGKNRTALHWAAEAGHLLVVLLLTGLEADVSIQDAAGKMGSELAHDNRHDEVTQFLVAQLAAQKQLSKMRQGLVQLQEQQQTLTAKLDSHVQVYEQQMQQTAEQSSPKELQDILRVKKPAAKSSVPFNEVSRVPLDEFYQVLFSNQDANNQAQPGNKRKILDLRAPRWYREYQALVDQISDADLDRDLAQGEIRSILEELKIVSKWPRIPKEGAPHYDSDLHDALKAHLARSRAELHKATVRLNAFNRQKVLLKREMRSEGYVVDEDEASSPDRVIQIFKTYQDTRGYKVLEGMDLSRSFENDPEGEQNWKGYADELFDYLKKEQLSEKPELRYKSERDQLAEPANVDALMASDPQVKVWEELIQAEKEVKTSTQSELDNLGTAEEDKWNEDIGTLRAKNKTSSTDFSLRGIHFRWLLSLDTFYEPQTPYPTAQGFLDAAQRLQNEIWLMGLFNKVSILRKKMKKIQIDIFYSGSLDVLISGTTGIALVGPRLGPTQYYYVSKDVWGGRDLFSEAIALAEYMRDQEVAEIEWKRPVLKSKINEAEQKITQYELHLTKISKEKEGKDLAERRREFLRKWNDPERNTIGQVKGEFIQPDEDPLADHLVTNVKEGAKGIFYFFETTSDGLYNQYGQSVGDFIKWLTITDPSVADNALSVFPTTDSRGRPSNEVLQVIAGPLSDQSSYYLPSIKFVENYTIDITWEGFGVGELSHSFNLFPGETRELVVERRTKLTSKISEEEGKEATTSETMQSSFEENLQDEFSTGQKSAQTVEEKRAQEKSAQRKQSQERGEESQSSSDKTISAEASYGVGGFGASISGSMSTRSSRKASYKQAEEQALSEAQSQQESVKNDQSTELFQKRASSAINKVSSKTSQSNKVQFSSVSTQESEEFSSTRETIHVENPNMGRTIDYNFFQTQNLYSVTISLRGVQIVVDPGIELIAGTGIRDTRVFNLQDFGKIYANSGQSDRWALLSAVIARQVFNHYGAFMPGLTKGNGAIAPKSGYQLDREVVEILRFNNKRPASEQKDGFISRIKQALAKLKRVPFTFNNVEVAQEPEIAINSGGYHIESQVGLIPATEEYLEERRNLTTETQRSELKHLQALTKARVFNPVRIPDIDAPNPPTP